MQLLKNDLYEDGAGTRFRLLQVSPGGDEAWVINLTDRGSWPRKCTYKSLAGRLEQCEIKIVTATSHGTISSHTDAAKKRRDSIWATIQTLVVSPAIFEPMLRGPLVNERAQATGVSKTSINKYLRDYWCGGQTRDALIPRFANIGLTRTSGTSRRGRVPVDGRYTVYQMDHSVDNKKIIAAVKKHYLNGEVSTLTHAYVRMLKTSYSYLDGNGAIFLMPEGERPTFRQFYTVAKKAFPLELVLRKKKGDKDFERDHDMRIGSALYEAVGVGYIYEIDATIADVYLVAMADRSKIIGKPTMYLIYDRFSRLCVGFYVGLESAAWESAVQAILTLAEDKTALCAKYGVTYDQDDWPAHGVFPQRFLGDCGEMISRNSNRICDGLEATVENAPPLSPQNKGTVECGFKLIHASIASATPGYEPPANVTRRRGKHYEKDASLTLDEFTGIILRAIITHNRRQMKRYSMSPEVILREVVPTPRDIWADDVIHRAGNLSRYSEEHLRMQLLPRANATVTEQGIHFKGCYYSCDAAISKGWFVMAKRRRRTVSVTYDRRLVDRIVVHNPENARESYLCELTTTSQRSRGYSFAEVQYIQTRAKGLIRATETQMLQETADLQAFIDDVADSARRAMKEASKGKSRTARKADIVADRNAERRQRRQTRSLIVEAPTLSPHSEACPDNVVRMIAGTQGSRSDLANKRASGAAADDTVPSVSNIRPMKRPETGTPPLTIQEKLRQKRQEMINANAK